MFVLEEFFGRSLEIDGRLLQALTLTDDLHGEFITDSGVLLATSMNALPSLSNLMVDQGIDLTAVPSSPLHPLSGLDVAIGLEEQLEVWFTNLDRVGRPTRAFRKVVETGRVGLLEVLRGCLEARYLDDRRGLHGEGHVSTNDLVGAVAAAAGISEDDAVDELAVEALCDRLDLAVAQLEAVDASVGTQQFLMYHDGGRIRLQPFGVHGAYSLEDQPLPNGSLWVARGNVIQESPHFSPSSLAALEEMINSDAPELAFQEFFEEHQEFAFALGDYGTMHPQLILSEDDGGKLIPDFFLERIDSDLVDICDLKRPTAELVRAQRHRLRFRDAVDEAVAQVTEYRDWFEDRANRTVFKDRYGLKAYRPRVVVVIGRRHSYYDDVERMKLESRLPGWVSLRTYDDIAARARKYRRLFAP